ncbi:MAG: DUF3300 domain-containing protein [Tepidisphaeraceae bacterium]
MNSGRLRGSRCLHALAAIAFVSTAGCVIQVTPIGQSQQVVETSPPSGPEEPAADPALQQLVSPIALYPDPILADVLPASTYPDQVQQAEQFLQYNPTPPDDLIAGQNWDPSVQSLVHYPSVLQYMAANPDWTASLGSAFTSEQPQVMEAIQDLRAQAQAVGNLTTTPDEYVVDEGGFIYIRPAVDGVIVIPFYDPILVYRQRYMIDYRYRYRDGVWLDHGFDWQHHDVYTGDWHRGWAGGPGDWHRDPSWAPPQQHWAHDDRRFGPVHQVAPEHYAQPHELAGREFHPVPARPAKTEYHEPDHVQPQRHDDRSQNQPRPDEQPKAHVNTPPPPPLHAKSPPPPPAQPHAKPMPPTKQAPPAKPKGPPQKPEGGN